MPDFRDPPSSFTGSQLAWLRDLVSVIRTIPTFSYFTQTTPNGNLYGKAGDRAVYIGSTSTLSREWVNANEPEVVSTNSWVQIRVLP